MMTHQKCLEFYLPWVLSLFTLPRDLDIVLREEHPEHKDWRGSFNRSASYPCVTPYIVLYTNKFETVDQMMTTLFHELTHAQQHRESRLIDRINPTQTIWRDTPNQTGKIYSEQVVKDHYWNLPWEIEAREVAHEKCLEFMKRFKSLNPFRKIQWWRFKPTNQKKFTIRSSRIIIL